MAYTNFIGDGVSVNGAPLIPGGGTIPLGASYFFVCNRTGANGANGNEGTFDAPFSTIDYAIGQCTANAGDVIVVMQGHAETITGAGGITCDVAGITIVGLGNGSDRPELTFGTSTGASVLITAANVKICNIVGITGVDALTNPFHVQAAGCTLDIEWQDPSSALQAVRAVLTTAAADNLNVTLKVVGQTSGGTAPVNAVRLVGVNSGQINCDFYGRASTAFVEFLTTACTNIEVYGYMYNSGTTDGSKNVIDTVTGSTWFADIIDGAAGAAFSGGSAAAMASDDLSGIGARSDSSVYVPGSSSSLMAYAKGTADLQERVAFKSAAVLSDNLTLFTIAGGPIKIESLFLLCVTNNDATASTIQFRANPTTGTAQTISNASASVANATAGATITLAGTALATAALYNANGPNLIANPGTILAPIGTIQIAVAVGSTTGTWSAYIRYKPLATGVTVS